MNSLLVALGASDFAFAASRLELSPAFFHLIHQIPEPRFTSATAIAFRTSKIKKNGMRLQSSRCEFAATCSAVGRGSCTRLIVKPAPTRSAAHSLNVCLQHGVDQ